MANSDPIVKDTDMNKLDRTPEPRFRDDVTVKLVKANASDADVVFAARVSTAGEGSQATLNADPSDFEGLIRYLARERHGTPFEHNSFTFYVEAPIFVFREFMRHRIGWCLPGDALVSAGSGEKRTIASLHRDWGEGSLRGVELETFNEDAGSVEHAPAVDVYATGEKNLVRVGTASGGTLRCTPEHRVWGGGGWVNAGSLQAGSVIARTRESGEAYFDTVTSVVPDGREVTYDIAMPAPWHSYIADGFVVHNSYNEESGRYRELAPVFYLPNRQRRLVQQGKPGHYQFVEGSDEQYETVRKATIESCLTSYAAYQRMLQAGVAREVARGVLPVATYSSMYATCNARSLMALLSLRVGDDGAMYPSHPQREIEMVAERMEQFFADLMPITHQAFVDSRRVCP